MASFPSNRSSRGLNSAQSDEQDVSNGFERMSMRGYRPDSSMSEISMDGARSTSRRQDAPNRGPYQEWNRDGYQGHGRGGYQDRSRGGYGNTRAGYNDTRGYYNHDYRIPQQERRGGGGGYQGGPPRGRGEGRGRGSGPGLNDVYRHPNHQSNRRYQQGIRAEDYENLTLEDFDGPSNQESSETIRLRMDNSSTNAEGFPEMPDGAEAMEPLPEFDEAAIAEEGEKIKAIHTVLTRMSTFLNNETRDMPLAPEVVSIEDLFDRIRKRHPKKVLFDYPSTLTKFVEDRKFLFDIGLCKKQPTNTGFAHRSGIQDIVSFIQRYYVHVHGCKLSDLLKFCQDERFFRVYMSESWNQQPWNDTYFFFTPVVMKTVLRMFEEYSDYFEVTRNEEEDGFVKLTPLAKSIPSLWKREVLPKHPTVPYWDGSRKRMHMVHIVSVTSTYVKGVIQVGRYVGRSVYNLAIHAGLSNTDMREAFPHGTMALSMAHYTLGHKNDLKGMKMAAYDIWNTRRDKTLQRSFASVDEVKKMQEQGEESPNSSQNSGFEGLEGDSKLLLHRALNWERQAMSFVDNILGDNALNEEQLRDAVIGNLGPFGDTREIVNFISDRPHLYEINALEQVAFRLDPTNRAHHVAFLRFLAKKGAMGTTYPEMLADLKIGKAGYHLQMLSLEGAFGTFFNRISKLYIEFNVVDPRETRYRILGTIFDSEGICLPQFSIGYTVV